MPQKTQSSHANWTHFDPRANALYIHLHSKGNQLLRIADGRAEAVLNGTELQLEPNSRIQAIEFDRTVQPATAVRELKELVADCLPVHPNHRWMVISWLLTAFFLDCDRIFCKQKALLRFTGESLSGKSTAGRLLSALLYGADHLVMGSADYVLKAASEHPLLILEPPLDKGGRVPFNRLFLSLAEGKPIEWKENGRVQTMNPRSLVALAPCNEDFDFPELVPWTYQVECRRKYHKARFLTSHPREVSRRRSRILSGIFQLFASDVVPDLVGRRIAALEDLSKAHPGHSKNQVDSFLALMVVILQALLGVLHGDADRADSEFRRMMEIWIEDQAGSADIRSVAAPDRGGGV